MQHGLQDELDAVAVDAGEGVAEVDGYAVAEAGCQPEHALLAAGAGQAGPERGDRGGPVDDGQRGAVAAGRGGDEAAGEVGAGQERGVADEQLDSGFVGGDPAGPGAQPAGGARGVWPRGGFSWRGTAPTRAAPS